ncbi:hypothetical protein GF362_03255 [Candidatus Dojkabacteria bacterium]|nr:hypothetical protein [Candidatus Dojkabacteria bacterium]
MNQELEKYIKSAYTKSARSSILAGIIIFVFSLFLVVVLFLDKSMNNATLILAVLFTIFIFILALYMIIRGIKLLNPNNSRVLDILKNEPHKVVWIYEVRVSHRSTKNVKTNVGKQSLVKLMLDNGKQLFAFQTVPDDAQKLVAVFKKLLPHATVGYTKERMAQYKKNPESLRIKK